MRTWIMVVAAVLLALPAQADRVDELEARLDRLERALAQRPKDPGAYTLPNQVTFCGESVDLSDPWIRERLEKELLLVLGDRAQIALWTKRAGRVFPVIEKQAEALGTCPDLKYLAVVESGLRPAVTSRAAARGWWQFMSGTAKQYGLAVDRTWDERADLNAATRAGLGYLKSLHGRFGSWPLAMAAYNTGPGRLSRAQKAQGLNDFWQLDLYTEAERYVPRIMAVKTVLANPARYDLVLRPEDGWAPRKVGFVQVTLPERGEISVQAAAKAVGVPVRTLRLLNPELGGDALPGGRPITLEVPQGKAQPLRDWLVAEGQRQAALAKASARKARKRAKAKQRKLAKQRKARKARKAKAKRKARYYRVRRGDSLWDIAQASKCTVAELRRWNRLGRKSAITPGQRLIVRPARG